METKTANSVPPLTAKERKDMRVLVQFTSVYCQANHADIARGDMPDAERLEIKAGKYPVCNECGDFLVYACERRIRCPLDPKPICKGCTVHCYRPGHREKVREIMRFSGMYLIKRGRLDLLWHYFF
jgi:hypothetical protein